MMRIQKQTIFKIIAALLPVFFLIFIEIFFRLFNFFPQTPLFLNKSQNGKSIIEINSIVGERYFNKKNIPVPNLYPQTFAAKKESDTFRIFCLGGSTTAGFPYEMTVPFPQQLKFKLEQDYPKKNFEVVNMGLSAINSFTVLDWIPDIIKHSPDLIVIYMGHNEFYGAYGTGSSISLGNSGTLARFMIKAQKFRVMQMLKRFVNLFVPDSSSKPDHTLMEKMIDNKTILVDSHLREITYKNYSKNLDLILSACKKREIPVILSNLINNLKDQPPLGEEGRKETDPQNAGDYYRIGVEQFHSGDSIKAFQSFCISQNLDEIPFRAPEEINAIIFEKSKQYDLHFIDMLETFKTISPLGIPGNNLFCDHLHPNPTGYKLMASRFRESIIHTGLLPSIKFENEKEINPLFVTPLDWEIGGVRVFKLKQRWPFSNKEVDYSKYTAYEDEKSVQIAKDFLFEHHIWGKSHGEIANHYIQNGDFLKACREYQAILAIFPDKLDYHMKLIEYAKRSKQWGIVENTCKKALNLTSVKGLLYYNLAIAERSLGKLKNAFDNVNKALKSQNLNHEQLSYVFYLKALILVDIKEYEDAKKILTVIMEEQPDFTAAKKLLEKLNVK